MLSLDDYKKRLETNPVPQLQQFQNINSNRFPESINMYSNKSIADRILNCYYVRTDINNYINKCKEKNKNKEKIHSKGFSACEGDNKKFNQELEEDAVFDNPYSIHHMEQAYQIWPKDSLFAFNVNNPSPTIYYEELRKTQNINFSNYSFSEAKKYLNLSPPQLDKSMESLNSSIDFNPENYEARLQRAKIASKLNKWDIVLEDTEYLIALNRSRFNSNQPFDHGKYYFFQKYFAAIFDLNDKANKNTSNTESTEHIDTNKRKRELDQELDSIKKRARSIDNMDRELSSNGYYHRNERPDNRSRRDRYMESRSPEIRRGSRLSPFDSKYRYSPDFSSNYYDRKHESRDPNRFGYKGSSPPRYSNFEQSGKFNDFRNGEDNGKMRKRKSR